MQIEPKHIAAKKRVGTLHGQPVIQILLKGGLFLVTTIENGKPKTIGAGPHQAVARYMAERAEPDIQMTELSKDEQVSEAGIRSVIPEYEKIRDNWNLMLAKLDG